MSKWLSVVTLVAALCVLLCSGAWASPAADYESYPHWSGDSRDIDVTSRADLAPYMDPSHPKPVPMTTTYLVGALYPGTVKGQTPGKVTDYGSNGIAVWYKWSMANVAWIIPYWCDGWEDFSDITCSSRAIYKFFSWEQWKGGRTWEWNDYPTGEWVYRLDNYANGDWTVFMYNVTLTEQDNLIGIRAGKKNPNPPAVHYYAYQVGTIYLWFDM